MVLNLNLYSPAAYRKHLPTLDLCEHFDRTLDPNVYNFNATDVFWLIDVVQVGVTATLSSRYSEYLNSKYNLFLVEKHINSCIH